MIIKFIEFWDLGNNCKITISKDSIQRFAPVSSRQGTNIFLKSGPSIWVQEDYETVKKLVAQAEKQGINAANTAGQVDGTGAK